MRGLAEVARACAVEDEVGGEVDVEHDLEDLLTEQRLLGRHYPLVGVLQVVDGRVDAECMAGQVKGDKNRLYTQYTDVV